MWSELLAIRCETRSNFIEQEENSTLSYLQDLKLSLENSKKALNSLTVVGNSEEKVSVGEFSKAFLEMKRLFAGLKSRSESRDVLHRKLLISRQLVEESRFRVMEMEADSEETIADANFKLCRQEKTISKVEKYIQVLLEELDLSKEISSRIIPISTLNLSIHNDLQVMKDSIAFYTRRKNQVKAVTKNLRIHAQNLCNHFLKNQVFVKNLRSKSNDNQDQVELLTQHLSFSTEKQQVIDLNERIHASIDKKLKKSRISVSKLFYKNINAISQLLPYHLELQESDYMQLNEVINSEAECTCLEQLKLDTQNHSQGISDYSSVDQSYESHEQDSAFFNFVSEI